MDKRVYTKNEDGTMSVTTVPYTVQDQIAEKEAKLLEIYNEIETLRAQLPAEE